MKTIISFTCPAFSLFAVVCFAVAPQARADCRQGCDGSQNTFLGENALLHNDSEQNTAVGFDTMVFNTFGHGNTAVGLEVLYSNTSGHYNTAVGLVALNSNTTGFFNTATGVAALALNTGGNSNTADGVGALNDNSGGNSNTATGFNALSSNSTGSNNTASGDNALSSNTTGSLNIALGAEAGRNLTTGSSNIYIGNPGGSDDESGKIRIGRCGNHSTTFIAGISGAAVADGVGVIVGNNGKLGTVVSSARFKEAIKPMDKASEAILALKPVTFRYKHELDPAGIPQFGLVAEDVEKVNPDLVARDEQDKPRTVRYEAVNAMLLNEFLKEHRKNEAQQATIAQLKSGIETLTATIKEQAAQIQKVSARLDASNPAAQVALQTH